MCVSLNILFSNQNKVPLTIHSPRELRTKKKVFRTGLFQFHPWTTLLFYFSRLAELKTWRKGSRVPSGPTKPPPTVPMALAHYHIYLKDGTTHFTGGRGPLVMIEWPRV